MAIKKYETHAEGSRKLNCIGRGSLLCINIPSFCTTPTLRIFLFPSQNIMFLLILKVALELDDIPRASSNENGFSFIARTLSLFSHLLEEIFRGNGGNFPNSYQTFSLISFISTEINISAVQDNLS